LLFVDLSIRRFLGGTLVVVSAVLI
jgi:hypothetical protein